MEKCAHTYARTYMCDNMYECMHVCINESSERYFDVYDFGLSILDLLDTFSSQCSLFTAASSCTKPLSLSWTNRKL